MSKKAVKAEPTDTERLDRLGKTDGFLVGSCEGKPAYRIIARGTWHPSLRAAIDELILKPTLPGRSK